MVGRLKHVWDILLLLCCVLFVQVACEYKIVCYFSNWSQYRSPPYKFTADEIDGGLCTHVVLAFAQLDPDTMDLAMLEYNDAVTYAKLMNLKSTHSRLKTLIAVGGYGSKSIPFSKMSSLPELREQFINQSLAFVTKYGFDGLDLDWEYPTRQTTPNGEEILEEKEFYSRLLMEMGVRYKDAGLLLSAAVSAGIPLVDQAYDVPVLNRYLDFVSLMSYDFNGPWNKMTGHSSPLRSKDTLNVVSAAEHWLGKGLDKSKLVIGLSTYGRTFNLADPSNTGLMAPIDGAGTHGKFTGELGIMAYYEVCEELAKSDSEYRQHWLDDQSVPYIEDGDNWIGYENERSIKAKVDWIKKSGLGGAMIWTLDLDDFPGMCPTSMERYPILTVINSELRAKPGSPGEPCVDQVGGAEYCIDPYAMCDNSVCACRDGYQEQTKLCKRVVEPGTACTHLTDVCSNGSACDSWERTCVCTGATFLFNGKCLPKSGMGESCPVEVGGAACVGERTICERSTCICKPYTSDLLTAGVCIPDKETGGRCVPEDAKPCEKFVDKCVCDSRACLCTTFEFCKYREDGFYADPDDCRRYYRCVHRETFHNGCSQGLFWDNEFAVCSFNTAHCNNIPLPPSTVKARTRRPTVRTTTSGTTSEGPSQQTGGHTVAPTAPSTTSKDQETNKPVPPPNDGLLNGQSPSQNTGLTNSNGFGRSSDNSSVSQNTSIHCIYLLCLMLLHSYTIFR